MAVGYHVLWQIISDSGPPFPYLYSNGNAEMCLSLNSTVAILIDGDPLAILTFSLGLLNWVVFLATEGVSLGKWICFNRHTLCNMPLRRQDRHSCTWCFCLLNLLPWLSWSCKVFLCLPWIAKVLELHTILLWFEDVIRIQPL